MSEPLLPGSPSGVTVDSAASPNGAASEAVAASSSPFSGFSAGLSSKLASAKAAVANISLSIQTPSDSAGSGGGGLSLDSLTSPVRAQVDAAMSRASAELRSKMAKVEEELRAQAARMDAELSAAKAELSAKLEVERAALQERVEARTAEVRAQLRAEFDAKKAEFEAKKLALHSAALAEFEKMLLKLLDEKVLPLVQQAALDPLMPLWVQRLVRGAIESAWPDVKEEIVDAWAGVSLKFEPIDPGTPPSWCPNFISAARASFVYHTYPFDRNIWWLIRRPMWWFWTLVAAFPLYGVQAAYFIFLFLCLDHRDEHQMVSFILGFKGAQFFTLGIVNCVIGALSFYRCVGFDYTDLTLPPPAVDAHLLLHDCASTGPGALPGFYTDMILFGIQGLTIWTAMALLPSTVKKGLRKTVAGSPPRRVPRAAADTANVDSDGMVHPEVKAGGCCSFGRPVYGGAGGGKLRWLVMYDACVLLFLVGVGVLLLFIRPYDVLSSDGAFSRFEWLFKQDLFFLKTAYGLLSFPFLVLILPVVSQLLLHTRPTGYNRAGVCVPVMLAPNEPALVAPEEAAEGLADDAEGKPAHTGAALRPNARVAWSAAGADHAIDVKPAV